jgi:hypothetical protein
MFKALCSVTLSALLVFSAVAQTNPGSAPSTLVGCVQKNGDIYTLTDETSKVTTQLRGGGLKEGRHVQVTGTPAASATPASGATQVFDVTRVTSVAGNCQAATAGSSFMSGAEHKRATFVAIFVIAAVTAGAAIATASRQGSARGTTNNDAPAINH